MFFFILNSSYLFSNRLSQNEYYYLGRLNNVTVTSNSNSSYFGFSNLNPVFNDLFLLLKNLTSFKIAYFIFVILISILYARFFKNLSYLFQIDKIYFFLLLPLFFLISKLNYADIYLVNFEITPNDIAWSLFLNFLLDFYNKKTFASSVWFSLMFLTNPSIFIFALPVVIVFIFNYEFREILKFSFISFLLSIEQIIFVLFTRKNLDPILYAFNQKASEYYFFINKPHHYAPFGNSSNLTTWQDLYIKIIIISLITIFLNIQLRKKSEFLNYLLNILNLQLFLQFLFLTFSYFEITNLHLLIFPFKGIVIVTFLIVIISVKEFLTGSKFFYYFLLVLSLYLYYFIDYFPNESFNVNFITIFALLTSVKFLDKKYLLLLLAGIFFLISFWTFEESKYEIEMYKTTEKSFNFLKNSESDIILAPNSRVNLFWSLEFETEKPTYFINKFIPHDFKYLPEWQIRYENAGRFYDGECELIKNSNLLFIDFSNSHPCGELILSDGEIFVFKKIK